MGYTVEYTPETKRKYPPKKVRQAGNRKVLWGILTCAVLLALVLLRRNGILREVLIPGDADVTLAAAGKLMENLKSGDGFYQSVRTFCQDILLHGQVY